MSITARTKKERERVRRRLILGYAAVILGIGWGCAAVGVILGILINKAF